MDFVALDFETTGYQAGCVNEPWQLGVAVVRANEIVERREWFFRSSMRPDAPELMEVWPAFYPILAGARLVAHNCATERTILTRLAPLTKWGPWVDTLKIARTRYPKLPSYALGDLCATFDCVPTWENRTWHDGLYDAIACAELALRFGL